jgi:hypothetical protein
VGFCLWDKSTLIRHPANLKKKKLREAHNLIGALLILSGVFCLWDDG